MIGRGNQSIRRKCFVHHKPPHAARTQTRAAAVGSQCLTAELRHSLVPNVRQTCNFHYIGVEMLLEEVTVQKQTTKIII
jgi:hypothetical protein